MAKLLFSLLATLLVAGALANVAYPCGDGTDVTCDLVSPTCGDGYVLAVIQGCYRCISIPECAAHRFGNSVAPTDYDNWGETPCGDKTCTPEEYCYWLDGNCGYIDGLSECRPRADGPLCQNGCSSPRVCGCDGRKYCNECTARERGGVSVADCSYFFTH